MTCSETAADRDNFVMTQTLGFCWKSNNFWIRIFSTLKSTTIGQNPLSNIIKCKFHNLFFFQVSHFEKDFFSWVLLCFFSFLMAYELKCPEYHLVTWIWKMEQHVNLFYHPKGWSHQVILQFVTWLLHWPSQAGSWSSVSARGLSLVQQSLSLSFKFILVWFVQ